MWVYQVCLKDGTEKEFLTDEPYVPDDYLKFCEENKDSIDDVFCDHFPMTISEWKMGCVEEKEQ